MTQPMDVYGTPAAAAPAFEAVAPDTKEVPFVFSGQGGEYFRIWIVNILLSLLTLGIYSAWAKVRNKQYFYGNTSLDDASFVYTANPVRILIGRAIAAVLLTAYVIADNVSLVVSLSLLGVFFLAMPWVVCMSLRFNARYSRYRNVPFAFTGTVGRAYVVYLLWPIVGIISLGFLWPYAYYKQQQYLFSHHTFGQSCFRFSATAGNYYMLFLKITGTAILLGAALGAITVAMADMPPFALAGILVSELVAFGLTAVMYLFIFACFAVLRSNLQFNNLHLHGHHLVARWELLPYFKLYFVNTLAIVASLGLLIPWAKVRIARYKAQRTWASIQGDLDSIVSQEEARVSSLGEGIGDLFDIDVGF